MAASRRTRETGLAAAMLAPSLAVLGVFVLYPLAKAVWLGHQRCNSQGKRCRSNGWDQYTDVLRSKEFHHALVVTTKFALITVPLGLILGVGLAVLADRHLRGIGIFRTIFSSTVATSIAVASLMWLFLLQPSVGVLSNIGWIGRLFPVIKSGMLEGPWDGTGVGGDVERLGEPRVHVHRGHGRSAGHPA